MNILKILTFVFFLQDFSPVKIDLTALQIQEEKIVIGIHAHALSVLTISKIRKTFNKFDSKSVAKQVSLVLVHKTYCHSFQTNPLENFSLCQCKHYKLSHKHEWITEKYSASATNILRFRRSRWVWDADALYLFVFHSRLCDNLIIFKQTWLAVRTHKMQGRLWAIGYITLLMLWILQSGFKLT